MLYFISCFSTNAAVRISTQIPKTYYNRFQIYFNHSDHLGSATFITDYYGEAKQFLHYMPYGELFANQQSSSYNERFKFVARTSQQHFGLRRVAQAILVPQIVCTPLARNSQAKNATPKPTTTTSAQDTIPMNYITGLPLTPLADKYPSISPYAYCENNPIITDIPENLL